MQNPLICTSMKSFKYHAVKLKPCFIFKDTETNQNNPLYMHLKYIHAEASKKATMDQNYFNNSRQGCIAPLP